MNSVNTSYFNDEAVYNYSVHKSPEWDDFIVRVGDKFFSHFFNFSGELIDDEIDFIHNVVSPDYIVKRLIVHTRKGKLICYTANDQNYAEGEVIFENGSILFFHDVMHRNFVYSRGDFYYNGRNIIDTTGKNVDIKKMTVMWEENSQILIRPLVSDVIFKISVEQYYGLNCHVNWIIKNHYEISFVCYIKEFLTFTAYNFVFINSGVTIDFEQSLDQNGSAIYEKVTNLDIFDEVFCNHSPYFIHRNSFGNIFTSKIVKGPYKNGDRLYFSNQGVPYIFRGNDYVDYNTGNVVMNNARLNNGILFNDTNYCFPGSRLMPIDEDERNKIIFYLGRIKILLIRDDDIVLSNSNGILRTISPLKNSSVPILKNMTLTCNQSAGIYFDSDLSFIDQLLTHYRLVHINPSLTSSKIINYKNNTTSYGSSIPKIIMEKIWLEVVDKLFIKDVKPHFLKINVSSPYWNQPHIYKVVTHIITSTISSPIKCPFHLPIYLLQKCIKMENEYAYIHEIWDKDAFKRIKEIDDKLKTQKPFIYHGVEYDSFYDMVKEYLVGEIDPIEQAICDKIHRELMYSISEYETGNVNANAVSLDRAVSSEYPPFSKRDLISKVDIDAENIEDEYVNKMKDALELVRDEDAIKILINITGTRIIAHNERIKIYITRNPDDNFRVSTCNAHISINTASIDTFTAEEIAIILGDLTNRIEDGKITDEDDEDDLPPLVPQQNVIQEAINNILNVAIGFLPPAN